MTSERLSVINDLRDLKKEEGSGVLSYYTQAGRIFVKTSVDKEVRPTEIPFGVIKSQIRELCKGDEVELSSSQILDLFREVHCQMKTNTKKPSGVVHGMGMAAYSWVKISRGKTKSKCKVKHTPTDKMSYAPAADPGNLVSNQMI